MYSMTCFKTEQITVLVIVSSDQGAVPRLVQLPRALAQLYKSALCGLTYKSMPQEDKRRVTKLIKLSRAAPDEVVYPQQIDMHIVLEI